VASDGFGVLIDAGLSGRDLEERLNASGINPKSIGALILTHDHRDHCHGAGVWARRYGVKLYAPAGVPAAIAASYGERTLNRVKVEEFEPGGNFAVEGMEFASFKTSHDAHASVGFRIKNGLATIGFATDLGLVDQEVERALSGCDMLYLESNHDEEMLRKGPYPYFLKRRIASDVGHLSNSDASKLLRKLVNPNLKGVILGHLSETNNDPAVAYGEAHTALALEGAEEDVLLLVARQSVPGRIVDI